MNSIIINGASTALKAGEWCRKQFGTNWNLDIVSMGNDPSYEFKFFNKNDASFFALRWAGAYG